MHKGSFYPRMAFVNLLRNGRFYGPYLLTVIGAAAAYYITVTLSGAPDLSNSTRYSYLSMFMSFGSFVIAVFSVIFLTYTNSFLMKRRKKELGLYNVLGMGKPHIAIVLSFEALYSAAVGLLGGILFGMLMQKLLTLLLCKMMRFPVPFGFYISGSAIFATIALFGGILLFNLLLNYHRIRVQNPMELMRESSAGEREPKTRWLPVLLGVVCLGGGYGIAITTRSAMTAFSLYFIAVLLVIIGTYCLFTAVSIAVLKALRKNKQFYYRINHFIGVSGMLYRMKRNAVGLSNICILSTMVLVMISGTLSLYLGGEDALQTQFPGDLKMEVGYDLTSTPVFDSSACSSSLISALEERETAITPVVAYRFLSFAAEMEHGVLEPKDHLSSSALTICAITSADYTALTGIRAPELPDGQMMAFQSGTGQSTNLTFRFPGKSDLTLASVAPNPQYPAPPEFNPTPVDVWYLVVSDKTFSDLFVGQTAALSDRAELVTWRGFWKLASSNGAISPDLPMQLEESFGTRGPALANWKMLTIDTRENFGADYYSINGGFFFLGVFLGTIFLMAAVLIIYYKQISEGYEDRERYLVMQKVGMDPITVRRSINSQLLVVFFAPLLVAAVHVAFDFSLMTRLLTLFSLHNPQVTLLCTAGTLGVFTVVYALVYRVTAKAYYKLVRS